MEQNTPLNGRSESEKYVNKTFRLRSSSIALLESDAERMGVSVNSVIQNAIQRFIEWDRYSDSIQMTSFLPNVLDSVLKFIDEDTARDMALQVVETSCFKDACLLIFKRYDVETLVKMMNLLDRFGNNFRLQEGEGERGGVSMSLYHNYGRKWSVFLGTILNGELERLKVEQSPEISDNAIVLRFNHNELSAIPLKQ